MNNENPKKEYVKLQLVFMGGACIHNLKCWLCNENPAVYNMHPNWCFEPCWDCQNKIGGKLYRIKNKLMQKIVNKL
jgi:hypothetical protein